MTHAEVKDIESTSLSPFELARALWKIGAVVYSEKTRLTWSSGLQVPFYCDNRVTNGHPVLRRRITNSLVSILASHGIEPDIVVGVATAGIPQAALLADRLGIPLAYVRGNPKGHGRGRQVEGAIVEGQRAVVVEDLVATGGSVLHAVDALRASTGAEVVAMLALFTYGFDGVAERFAQADIPFHTITDFDAIATVGAKDRILSDEEAAALWAWYMDPQGWSGRLPSTSAE